MPDNPMILDKLNELLKTTLEAKREFEEGVREINRLKIQWEQRLTTLETKNEDLLAKLQDASKIQDGSIGTAELANSAVSDDKLSNAVRSRINSALLLDNQGLAELKGGGHSIGNAWERLLEISNRSKVVLFRGENVNYAIGVNNSDQLVFFAFKEGQPKHYAMTIDSEGNVDTQKG